MRESCTIARAVGKRPPKFQQHVSTLVQFVAILCIITLEHNANAGSAQHKQKAHGCTQIVLFVSIARTWSRPLDRAVPRRMGSTAQLSTRILAAPLVGSTSTQARSMARALRVQIPACDRPEWVGSFFRDGARGDLKVAVANIRSSSDDQQKP